MKHSTNLIEIFSSIQGEGKYLGCRQIFLRFADCNLKCAYCDTNFNRQEFFNVETSAGSMKFKKIINPISVDNVIEIIKKFSAEVPTHSISFTGGEPLMHADFIQAVADQIDLKIFLETNGTLYNELSKIIDSVDIISMDLKLPSVVGKNLFEEHRKFIETAQAKDLYTKIVISNETTQEEFLTAIETIADVSKDILLILQPVTPLNGIKAISAEKILSLQTLALKYLFDVRVIPQTHKIINLL